MSRDKGEEMTDAVAAPAGRTRTIAWDDPVAGAQRGSRMSGMEYMRAIVAGEIPRPPIAWSLDFELAEVEEGRAVFTLTPREFHYNPIGVVHGGVAATLLDTAMACAVHSALPAGSGYTTLEFKVNFVRALTLESGPVRAEGTLLHLGRSMATAEGRLVGEDGRLYAHATTTCMIFGSPAAAPSS